MTLCLKWDILQKNQNEAVQDMELLRASKI